MEMKDVALKAVLQKPSFKSKCKQHSECVRRRFNLWKLGDFNGLLKECRAIQSRLQSTWKPRSPEHVSRMFANLMLSGKVNAAMRLLDDNSTSGVLQLSEVTLRGLKSKLPEPMEADKEILITGQVPFVDPEAYVEAYVACRLIPLDKCPGVRPIGIGEVIRHIIGKSIISVIKPDILMSTGSLQLAAGLPSGCEAAAHAMEEIFQEDETDASRRMLNV
ncbi:Hypothetical predicted protein [Paramuricea clavata]|uniref:Uncharacterized protein n=1 Tax=Paramuricea clavata TaxID=317549 RepID=A0A6S7HGM6_PARCT|nr:Hypothetical predicted protein [Paramuricea clavata]